MGPTRTLGMRLLCNFVNVYTITYRIQYMRTSLTDNLPRILPRKHVSDKLAARILVARACPARGKLNGEVAGHADFHARILARKSARMSVSVSVSWNSSLCHFIRMDTFSFGFTCWWLCGDVNIAVGSCRDESNHREFRNSCGASLVRFSAESNALVVLVSHA